MGPLFLPLTIRQLLFYLLAGAALLIFFCWDPKIFYTALTFVICGFYGLIILFRLTSVKLAFLKSLLGRPDEHVVSQEDLAALDPAGLPIYTILVPMYKEPEVADKITRYLTGLDYPQEKLDIKVLLEEDDPETRARIEALMPEMPPCVEVLVCPRVPKGEPRTKPRACNWGLERARGEYLVIFDAEDRPEADQLKKAIVAFRRLEARGRGKQVVCLQAKLNYFNARQNTLTKFFTLEYSNWFDLFLPGLHALRIPIPLGGTSNHFRTEMLQRLGGWDPYNVTEDCDLGIRMARLGYRTEVLDSTTWEEATSRVGNWIRQRSRWIKGYFQTHFVHTRQSFVPAFLLAGFFWILSLLLATDLEDPSLARYHHLSAPIRFLCLVLGLLSAGLGLWTLGGRVLARLRGRAKEGRLGLYHAFTFRLTVGGHSAMLLLNLLFWFLSGLYLFREPIADLLPPALGDVPIGLAKETPREMLRGWQLYYQKVTEQRYEGYHLWNLGYDWIVARELSWEDVQRIFPAIDIWSFFSQILYPVVIGLFLANFVLVLLGLVSCYRRGIWELAPFALLIPFYWVLISLAAFKGFGQLFWNPFYWEKTMHGFAQPPGSDAPAGRLPAAEPV